MNRILRRALLAAPVAASIALTPLAAAHGAQTRPPSTAEVADVGTCTLVGTGNNIAVFLTGWDPNQTVYLSADKGTPTQTDAKGHWDGFVLPDLPSRAYYGPTVQESVPCTAGAQPAEPEVPPGAIGTCTITPAKNDDAGTAQVTVKLSGWAAGQTLYLASGKLGRLILPDGTFTRTGPSDKAPEKIYYGEDEASSVPCTRTIDKNEPQQPGQSDQKKGRDYWKGQRKGYDDTRKNCVEKQPQPPAKNPEWQAGYDKGVADALATKHCQNVLHPHG